MAHIRLVRNTSLANRVAIRNTALAGHATDQPLTHVGLSEERTYQAIYIGLAMTPFIGGYVGYKLGGLLGLGIGFFGLPAVVIGGFAWYATRNLPGTSEQSSF